MHRRNSDHYRQKPSHAFLHFGYPPTPSACRILRQPPYLSTTNQRSQPPYLPTTQPTTSNQDNHTSSTQPPTTSNQAQTPTQPPTTYKENAHTHTQPRAVTQHWRTQQCRNHSFPANPLAHAVVLYFCKMGIGWCYFEPPLSHIPRCIYDLP